MRGIAASWVVTGDATQAPIGEGAVVLDANERIAAVGEAEVLRRRYGAARWEQQRAVLLPGLVNAHTHLELSALRARVPGGRGFGPWVTELQRVRDELSAEELEQAVVAAIRELLDAGTVAVGEVTNSLLAVPMLGGAPLLGRVFHEVFALRRDAGEARLSAVADQRALLTEWPANLSYALAPHTLFTLHPDILREVLCRARSVFERTSLHLCEHPAERAYLQHGAGPFAEFLKSRGAGTIDWPPPGVDPVRYALALRALAPDVLCVHLADARPDELDLVRAAGAPVVLCPRSNLHIELKLPPLIEILKAGIRPALGTDSLASCPTLYVMDEARALLERFPSVAPRTLIAMATSYGADALGLADRIGTLAEGLAPGAVAFEHDGPPPADPERFVLSRAAKRRTVLARPDTKSIASKEAA